MGTGLSNPPKAAIKMSSRAAVSSEAQLRMDLPVSSLRFLAVPYGYRTSGTSWLLHGDHPKLLEAACISLPHEIPQCNPLFLQSQQGIKRLQALQSYVIM